MTRQKNELNNHVKEITMKKGEVNEILRQSEVVEKDLEEINVNEGVYLRQQMEEYWRRQGEEEEAVPCKSSCSSDMKSI